MDKPKNEIHSSGMQQPSQNQIFNNESIDKGNIDSRTLGFVGGSLGGTMTRRLVELGEQILIEQQKNNGNEDRLE